MFFSVLFSILITSIGEERELVYMLLVRLSILHEFLSDVFSLPLGVRGWLRVMIVAFLKVFFLFFFLIAQLTLTMLQDQMQNQSLKRFKNVAK